MIYGRFEVEAQSCPSLSRAQSIANCPHPCSLIMTTKATTVTNLTRQLSNLDLTNKDKAASTTSSSNIRQPIPHKKTSSNSLKLPSKFAPTREIAHSSSSSHLSGAVKLTAASSGHIRTNSTVSRTGQTTRTNSTTTNPKSTQRTRTNSSATTSSTRSGSPTRAAAANAAQLLDIGQYDGGFELENEKRGSAVFGEAAELLALDSSRAA